MRTVESKTRHAKCLSKCLQEMRCDVWIELWEHTHHGFGINNFFHKIPQRNVISYVKSQGQRTLLFFPSSADSSIYVYVICFYICCCSVIGETFLDIIKCSSV